MSTESRYDSIGWVFFGSVWLIFLAPSFYLVLWATNDATPLITQIASAAFLAGIFAAVFSWIVNSILGLIAARRSPGDPTA